MATIPMGNFGNVMPQAQQGRVLDSGAEHTAQAVNQLGQIGQQVSNKKLNEAQKIQDEKDEYFFNTQAAKYGADYTDVVTDTKQRLAIGEFNEGSAKAYLRQKADELTENYRSTLPDIKHDKFNFYSEKMFLESEANIKPIAYETERRAINADFEQVGEATLKLENREQGLALYQATVDRNPVLTPEQRIESVQKWNERRDLSDAKGVLANLEKASDVEGLQKVYDSVDKIFPHMKVETRDTYKSNIESAIDRINKATEVAKNKALNEAKQAANDFRTDAYTGYPIAPERVNTVLAAVKGTEYESQVREDLAMNKDAQKFRRLSPLEQERTISQLTSRLENTPQKDGSLLQKQLSMYQGIANTSRQRAVHDPVAQLQSQSNKVISPITPEQIGSGQIDFKQSQINTALLIEQKKKNGGVGGLIQWNTTESKAFVDKYHSATPQQQGNMIADLNKLADTKTPEGRQARLEYMSLISGPNQANDYVAIAKLKQLDVHVPNSNLRAANLALEGKQLIQLNQHSVLGDAKQFMLNISPYFGNTSAVGTPERTAYQNLAYSIYLGLIKNQGGLKSDENGKPLINSGMAKQAFELASGGTYHQKLGKNTQTVFRTYGLNEKQFAEKLDEKVLGNYWKDTGVRIPSGFLQEHAIEQVPGAYGWYWFRNPDGSRHINPKTKKAYIVQITDY